MPLLSQTTSIAAHQGTSTTLSCLSLDNPPLQHNALLQRGFQTLSMHNRPTKSRGNFNKLFFRWNYRVTGIFFFFHSQELKVSYWQRSLAAWREASKNSIEDVAFCCKLLAEFLLPGLCVIYHAAGFPQQETHLSVTYTLLLIRHSPNSILCYWLFLCTHFIFSGSIFEAWNQSRVPCASL